MAVVCWSASSFSGVLSGTEDVTAGTVTDGGGDHGWLESLLWSLTLGFSGHG